MVTMTGDIPLPQQVHVSEAVPYLIDAGGKTQICGVQVTQDLNG